MTSISLFGPWRDRDAQPDAAQRLGIEGPVAIITAGSEEAESEDGELTRHLGCETINLNLWERAEDVMAEDPALVEMRWAHFDRLRAQQDLYRLALGHALEACRSIMRRRGDPELKANARDDAINAVRLLDRTHEERIHALNRGYDSRFLPAWWATAGRHRDELRDVIGRCSAVAIDGGHVRVLLNRLRLFGINSLIGDRPVLAWSAGAMALGPSVVLFHDSPPQGRSDPEVFALGLSLYRGVVPLPHARKRLKLDDDARVALFARRFAPFDCVVLDPRTRLTYDGTRWTAERAQRLSRDGGLEEMNGR